MAQLFAAVDVGSHLRFLSADSFQKLLTLHDTLLFHFR